MKWMENLHKLPTSVGLAADKGVRVVYQKNMLNRV